MNTNSQAVTDNSMEYAIHTEKLNLWYGTFQALFDVDLDIKQGIITSLIGPSGCGKSTFLRSVNRINERLGYVRTTGSIRVLGHELKTPLNAVEGYLNLMESRALGDQMVDYAPTVGRCKLRNW